MEENKTENDLISEYKKQISIFDNQILFNRDRLKQLDEDEQRNAYYERGKNQALYSSFSKAGSEQTIKELNKMENQYKEESIIKSNKIAIQREEIQKELLKLERDKERFEDLLKSEYQKLRNEKGGNNNEY